MHFFISSTCKDLVPERKITRNVLKGLEDTAYLSELDMSESVRLTPYLLELIRFSDAVIGVIGYRFGTQFESQISGSRIRASNRKMRRSTLFFSPDDICSVVQWELHAADCNRRPLMIFVKTAHNEPIDERQQQFRDLLLQSFRANIRCHQFSTITELARLLKHVVSRFKNKEVASLKRQRLALLLFFSVTVVSMIGTLLAEVFGLPVFSRNLRYITAVAFISVASYLIGRRDGRL